MEGVGLARARGGVKCSSEVELRRLPPDRYQNRNDALFSCRCVGQHGEVQRPGRVQLQHADPVRPGEGPVHRGAGGALRPGPQRHQQTAAATGKTRAAAARSR